MTYSAGRTCSSRRPAASPWIVPPETFRIVIVTVPVAPIGWLVTTPVRSTETFTFAATEAVLSSAESPATAPPEVAAIPPAGGSD